LPNYRCSFASSDLESTIGIVIAILINSRWVKAVFAHILYFANTRHATNRVTMTFPIIWHILYEYVTYSMLFNMISKDNQYNEIKQDSILRLKFSRIIRILNKSHTREIHGLRRFRSYTNYMQGFNSYPSKNRWWNLIWNL